MAEIRYTPDVHTLAALAAQLDLLTSNHPEALVVGSIGRAAILGDRLNLRRPWGAARDIDMTTTTGRPLVFTDEERAPFSVDSSFEGLITVDPARSTATVRYDVRRPDIAVEVPAEVFAPFPASIGGLRVNTFHPDTMCRVHLIHGAGGPKERRERHELEGRLRQLAYPRLPDRYFEPLAELAGMVAADPQLRLQRRLERIQDLYIDIVPFLLRRTADPVLQSIKHALVMGGRRQANPAQVVPGDLPVRRPPRG
jgi:hypothetical protein